MPANKPVNRVKKETKAEREERIRQQNEEETKRLEREEFEKMEKERRDAEILRKEQQERMEKEKEEETKKRVEHYQGTKNILEELRTRVKISDLERWDEILWGRYLRLDHLPDALKAPEINEYIGRWRDKLTKETIKSVFAETPVCLSLLDELNMALIECSHATEKVINSWKNSVKDLELILQEKLDQASYNLLLDAAELMDSSSFTTHESYTCDQVSISVWANMTQNPRNKGYSFDDLGYKFEMPQELVLKPYAVRFIYTTFDHCSKYSHVTREILEAAPPPPPSPEGGESMPTILDPAGYSVIGGLIHFDLIWMPPQAVYSGKWKIQEIETPAEISRVGYRVVVITARPPPQGMKPAEAAEFTEAEVRRYEEEMSKTVQVTIRLPKNVIYLDQPNPALWDSENNYWTTRSIFDGKYEEDKGCLSFKLCEFGILGVVQRKHPNLPYQSWILESEETDEGCVGSLSITGPLVHLVILIKGSLCRLKELHYGDQNIFGLFPHIGQDWKVALGLLGESPIEAWTYHCMALLASVYTFSFSRWNSTAGNGCIVLKCGQPDADPNKDLKDFLVSIKNDRCHEVTCADANQNYVEEIVNNDTFYGDLYHLILDKSIEEHKKKFESITPEFYNSVFSLLSLTRLCSFS